MKLAMILFTVTIILLIASITVFPKIKIAKVTLDTYYLVTLLMAIIFIICFKIGFKEIIDSLFSDSAINPIKILVLFFSMTIISIYLDEFGFFKFMATFALKHSKNNQISIFTSLFIIISILTMFTSNDIIILTFTPFIIYFCKNSKISPIPYLIMEFVSANTLSLFLLIGNPTNIYLGLAKNITFVEYFKYMSYKAIIISLVSYLILLLMFYKKLKVPIEKEGLDYPHNNKLLVRVSLAVLLLTTILMALSSIINIEMYLVALVFAIILSIFNFVYEIFICKNITHEKNVLKRLPYPLIPFLLSMFIICLGLTKSGFTSEFARILDGNNKLLSLGLSSFIACSFMNNIPMSVLFSNIINIGGFGLKETYAVILSSNIGALFTPLGALAGLMYRNIIVKNNIKFSYLDFVKYLMPISIILLFLGIGLLYI